jgi:hypothetical protein
MAHDHDDELGRVPGGFGQQAQTRTGLGGDAAAQVGVQARPAAPVPPSSSCSRAPPTDGQTMHAGAG